MVNLQLKMFEWVWLKQDGVCAAVRELFLFLFYLVFFSCSCSFEVISNSCVLHFLKEEFSWLMLYVV